MATDKTYSSVADMVRDVAGDAGFADEFEDYLHCRKIARDLAVLRASQGLTQADIARKLGCSQGRISKLENSTNAELKLGELAKYASSLGLHISVIAERNDQSPVDKVKHHALRMKEELDHLAELAGDDHSMAAGVSAFFGEAFINLVAILQKSAQKLPCKPDDGKPYISFEIGGVRPGENDACDPAAGRIASAPTPGRMALA